MLQDVYEHSKQVWLVNLTTNSSLGEETRVNGKPIEYLRQTVSFTNRRDKEVRKCLEPLSFILKNEFPPNIKREVLNICVCYVFSHMVLRRGLTIIYR